MRKVGLISGLFGRGELREYRRNRDGVDDYIIDLLGELSKDYTVLLDRDEIRNNKDELYAEIHLNVQYPVSSRAKRICLLMEDPAIRPQNILVGKVCYDKVITWNRGEANSGASYVWLPYPHNLKVIDNPVGAAGRRKCFVMIASNRNTLFDASSSLYNERQAMINYFEKNNPELFQLYGANWDKRMLRPGIFPRIFYELGKGTPYWAPMRRSKLSVWKGVLDSKKEVLSDARFNICYENKTGIDGYVSEKIYDSFAYGAIPIYVPSSELNNDIVPRDLYIDPRDFSSFDALVKHCLSFNEDEFSDWQIKMRDFVQSRKDYLSTQQFALAVCGILRSL